MELVVDLVPAAVESISDVVPAAAFEQAVLRRHAALVETGPPLPIATEVGLHVDYELTLQFV